MGRPADLLERRAPGASLAVGSSLSCGLEGNFPGPRSRRSPGARHDVPADARQAQPNSAWPTPAGTAVSKDVWMLGIGLGLLAEGDGDSDRDD
jgi:hypothetical protein